MTDVPLLTKMPVSGSSVETNSGSVKTKKSCVSWEMFKMEFKFSKLIKSSVFQYLWANKTIGCSEYSVRFAKEKMIKNICVKEIYICKILEIYGWFFFPTNDFSLLESCFNFKTFKLKLKVCSGWYFEIVFWMIWVLRTCLYL